MRIENVKVYGLEESIIASGYPRRITPPTGIEFDTEVKNIMLLLRDHEIGLFNIDERAQNHITRAIKLANTPVGSAEDNFLKGISVHYDLTAPEYFWRQFDRYHFHDYVSSFSKSNIRKFKKAGCINNMCNKFVSQNTVNEFEYHIGEFNNYKKGRQPYIELRDGSTIEYSKRNLYQMVIANCPAGFQLTARIIDNYLQLKTKYHQRKNHYLDDWVDYCKWIETLPIAKELIIGGE